MSNRVLFLDGAFIDDPSPPIIPITRSLSDINYTVLPTTFTSTSTWPNSCNLSCCWCTLTYDTAPIPFVNHIAKNDTGYSVDVGSMQFCSFNCYLAYIISTAKNIRDKSVLMGYMNTFYELFCGKKPTLILPSDPHTIMRQYGGQKTTDEYRASILQSGKAFAAMVSKESGVPYTLNLDDE